VLPLFVPLRTELAQRFIVFEIDAICLHAAGIGTKVLSTFGGRDAWGMGHRRWTRVVVIAAATIELGVVGPPAFLRGEVSH
jgi:hypothetical protein